MASSPTLPPQAYTREILTAAFNWLQTQPESVRKLATTPDALVGLFMRAQRFGHSTLESDAPVSSQNFMSDLRDLAEGLKQFEEPQPVPRRSVPLNQQVQQGHQNQQVPPLSQSFQNPMPNRAPAPEGLNEKSLAMIQEVKSHLNLSSDLETLNLMIALAYKNLRNLLA